MKLKIISEKAVFDLFFEEPVYIEVKNNEGIKKKYQISGKGNGLIVGCSE